MGRNAKRRRKAAKLPNNLTVSALQRTINVYEYGSKIWGPKVLRNVLPPGEDPIATRYDPCQHMVQVACASGKTYAFPYKRLEVEEKRADVLDSPLVIPGDVQIKPGLIVVRGDAEQVTIEHKTAIDQEAYVDKTRRELDQAWADYQAAKLQEHMNKLLEAADAARRGEGDGKPPPPMPKPTTLDEQYDIASARSDELHLAGKPARCIMHRCTRDHEIKLTIGSYCEDHGTELVRKNGVQLLDCDPNE